MLKDSFAQICSEEGKEGAEGEGLVEGSSMDVGSGITGGERPGVGSGITEGERPGGIGEMNGRKTGESGDVERGQFFDLLCGGVALFKLVR
jgi:hypothetical protein